MDNPIQVDLGRIAQDLQIRRVQVESVVQLLDEGNTVPFITRYRKERTGGLNEVVIREIQLRVGRLRELAERKETILKAIEAQGKLSEELAAAIRAADNAKRLEDLYLPYKPKKKTKASDARDRGLEPLALRIWNRDETLADLEAAAAEFVNPEKELETTGKVLEGVGHILAEAISELANVRDAVRRVVWKTGKVSTTKGEVPEGEGLEYRDYFNYSEPIAHIPPHRVLAINRGDKEGPLKVKLEVLRPEVEAAAFGNLPLEGHPQADFFRASAVDSLDRLLLPSMEREVRRDLTEAAERHAVDVFARNLRSLLLQPPIPKQVVLAIDPGLKSGCKVAVLDGYGNLLEHGVIHPHPPQNRRHEAKLYLKDLVGKHSVGVVAIGNGTACRETEELVAEIISEGTHFYLNPGSTTLGPEPAAQESPVASTSEPAAAEAPSSAPSDVTPQAMSEVTPAAEPAPSEAAPETATATATAEHAEGELPPLSGGSHDEDESAPAATEDGPTSREHPEPPPSSTPEAVDIQSEAEKADLLAHDESTANPAAEHTPSAEPAASTEAVTPTEPAAPGSETPPTGDIPPATETPAAAADASPTPPVPVKQGQGGGRPPRPKGEPRPPKPRTPPPPPKPHAADSHLAQLAYVIVNEAGASVYSTSNVGREEFPEFDATLRGTVSIGRRLQDPLAELVKIEPQNIGVGLYQHDVNPKQLKESLEGVISSCVNFVGVDLNTASVPLLRHVSGLNALTARRIVERRQEKGVFTERSQLTEIEGVGPVTYTQAAGFLKIPGGGHPLDRTWVHPESYEVALKALEKMGFGPEILSDRERLPELHAKMNEVDLPALAHELEVGEPTLHDIFEALARPDRDPRDDLPKPIFKKGVLKLEDLTAGMELKGTVLNVVDFGAFIDIGLKDSGLVHISQLANRYIKSPHDVVSVGDVVSAWVIGVDNERKRVSLTMVKPGTERPRAERGPGGGGGRRGAPQGQGQGQGQPQGDRRGGGGRPPRPSPPSPQLQGPPIGTPAGTGGHGPGQQGQGQQGPGGQGERRPPMDRGPGRGPGGPGGGRPGGPPSRGGMRTGGPGGASGRFERRDTAPRPAMPIKPSKPAPPPPPLSKDALTGSVPLRSFGQLKQLWQARVEDPVEEGGAPSEGQPATDQPEPSNEPQSTPEQSS
jgi:protein Tex